MLSGGGPRFSETIFNFFLEKKNKNFFRHHFKKNLINGFSSLFFAII
jgi:hypothetical protein